MTYDELADMYARLADVKPPEPIKLTREQWDSVKALVQPCPAPGWDFGGSPSPLFAVPIEIVTTVEESTPHLKGWAGWRVLGSEVRIGPVDFGDHETGTHDA